jgi:hypothetical protein
MAAYCSQTRASVISPYHPLQYLSSDVLFDNRFPDLVVSFNSIGSETLDLIRSRGGSELTVKGTKAYIIPAPDSDTIRALVVGGANKITPAPINAVNIASLASLSLVRRIFSNFFFTHQYPGFKDDNHMATVTEQWQLEDEGLKRKRPLGKQPGTSKRIHRDDDEEMDRADEEDEMEDTSPAPPPGHRIVWAIPPMRINKAWGNEDEIPDGHGLFVRYVEETQNAYGEKAVTDVICRYFIGCLGSDHGRVKAAFETLKKDMGVISGTSVGKELAHMARCIDFGLQCQARVFPIISTGQYLGCCLLGFGFQIAAYGSVYSPVNTTTLLENVGKAGSHRSAINAIASIAGGDADDILKEAMVNVRTMMLLRKGLEGVALTSEQRDQIVVLARGLRFGTKSLNPSAANIAESFRLLQMASEDPPVDRPLHHSALFEKDRLTVVWSAFGELAPTCIFAGGPQIDLTKPPSTRAKHIGFRMIPLKDAVVDIQAALSNKVFSNCSLNRRSGPFKDRIYNGLDGSLILNAMTLAAGVEQVKEKSGRAGPGIEGDSIFDEGF